MEHFSLSHAAKQHIMRRVYAVWFVRRALPKFVFEISILAVLAYAVAKLIFFARVFENMAASVSGIGEGIRFLAVAFAHTHTETQLALGLSLAAALLFARDTFKSVRSAVGLLK